MVQTHHSERGRSQKNELHRGPGCHVPALTRACGILSSGIFGSCQGHLPAAWGVGSKGIRRGVQLHGRAGMQGCVHG